MKKVLKKILPQSLQRLISSSMLRLVLPKVHGDLNLAFSVGDNHLFMDGWLAGSSGPIKAVHILDEQGNTTQVPFTAYTYARADVINSLQNTVPASHCFGYRMLIHYPHGNPRLYAVIIQPSTGASYTQRIADRYTDALRRPWKIENLSTTPEYYGLTQPIARIPAYNQLILAPSKTYFEKQKSFEGFVDGCYKGEDGSMLLFGWTDDNGKTHGKGHLINTETNRELSSAEMFRYYRVDLESKLDEPLGMLLFIKTLREIPPPYVRFQMEEQREVFLTVKENRTPSKALLDVLLLLYEQCRKTNLAEQNKRGLSSLFIPMIESLYLELQDDVFVAEEVRLGAQSPNPEVSIVIPLYKAYELTMHQMADFSIDPFLKKQNIILVLDAPEDSQRFIPLMHRLYDLYQVPVRVLIMSKNGGFSRACNAGASASSTPYMLFLNSDVFPKQSGWLESMLSRLKDDASIGVVGARLLFPDESIQHVGITWRRKAAMDHQLINHHPWKGMAPSLVPHHGAVEVPAVTAACLLCRTGEFRSLGMFDVGYIGGDYEDTDLCLKMREYGKRVVCDHAAVLYHVEGNSYPSQNRRKVFFYNAMRHELRWGKLISQFAMALHFRRDSMSRHFCVGNRCN